MAEKLQSRDGFVVITEAMRQRVLESSLLGDLYVLVQRNQARLRIIQSPRTPTDQLVKWHFTELIDEEMVTGKIWAAAVHDRVMPDELRRKLYSPDYIDHGVQHGFRVTQNGETDLVFAVETRTINKEYQKDLAIVLPLVAVTHDNLQVDSSGDHKHKRIGHEQIGGRFWIPGLMTLANIKGETNYSPRQIALAAAIGFNHEAENDASLAELLDDPAKLIKKYNIKFDRDIKEVFPALKELARALSGYGINLFEIPLAFSEVSLDLYNFGRMIFIAADLRDQVAPPFKAGLRTITTYKDRLFFDPQANLKLLEEIIDKLANPKINPEEKRKYGELTETDTMRAIIEIARGLDEVNLTGFAKSWMKYSQIKRGGYHVFYAKDMVSLGLGKRPETLEFKYLELAEDLENEAFREDGVKTNELSGFLKRLMTNNSERELDRILKIRQAEQMFKYEPFNQVGLVVIREFAKANLIFRRKFQVMRQAGLTDYVGFISQVSEIVEYAKKKNTFHASMVDSDVFRLPMRRLVNSLSELRFRAK
ncbi:MAG: hypothetical protein V1810_02450 [Candidatus Beckwithbacteria bacterium]